MSDVQKLLRRNVWIGLLLAVLTVIEYAFAIRMPVPLLLITISVIKTAFILRDYMHIGLLWSDDGGGH